MRVAGRASAIAIWSDPRRVAIQAKAIRAAALLAAACQTTMARVAMRPHQRLMAARSVVLAVAVVALALALALVLVLVVEAMKVER